MRIATWNIERRQQKTTHDARHAAAISELEADVIVVTEPGADFASKCGSEVFSVNERPGGRGKESWVAIVGTGLAPIRGEEIPYQHLATAASVEISGRRFAVYGSVLPWNAARSQAPDVYGTEERTFEQVFDRAIRQQVGDIESLQRVFGRDNVFWAGDFNHPLVGPLSGFSGHARAGILDALADVGMVAANRGSEHAKLGAFAIDLICGPEGLDYGLAVSSMPMHDGHALSDHRAYVVEVNWPADIEQALLLQ
jgi:hypothetical protein